jgi:hypothetical protein
MAFVLDIIAYHEWYNHPENDPYMGSYEGLFPLFDAVTPTESPATLTNRVATDVDMKLAFVHLDETGEVRVIHRIRRFVPQTGVLDPQDNMNICVLGDVFRSGVNFIELPEKAFHRTALLDRIPTPAAIATFLTHITGPSQFTALQHMGGDDFRPVRTRFIMLIPPMVVGRVLYATTQPGGLSPRDLWTEVATPLVDDELHRDVCAPFIDWCRVAVAGGVGEHNLSIPFVPVLLNWAIAWTTRAIRCCVRTFPAASTRLLRLRIPYSVCRLR